MCETAFSVADQVVLIFSHRGTTLSDFQQSARHCTKKGFQPKISTFFHFRTGGATFLHFSAKCTSLYKTAFSAGEQHVLSYLHWVHHFLTLFSKVSISVCPKQFFFSPRSARVIIFALGAPLINSFQQSARVCPKSKPALLARDQHVLSFSHCAHHLFSIFSKVHEIVQNSVFIPRSACFVIFTLGTPLLNVFSKAHEFVQNSVFSPR